MRTSSRMTVSRLIGRAAIVVLLLGSGTCRPRRLDILAREGPCHGGAEARGSQGARHGHCRATRRRRVTPYAREWVVRACRAAHDAVERVRNEAEKAEAVARSDAAVAEQLAREAMHAVQVRRREMERTRDRFLNQPLVAYDLSQHGRLTVNALTGAIDLSLDKGPGIKLGAGDLEALLVGNFKLPDVDPLELACRALKPTTGSRATTSRCMQASPPSTARRTSTCSPGGFSSGPPPNGSRATSPGRSSQQAARSSESSPRHDGRSSSSMKTSRPGSGSRASRTSGRIPAVSWWS